MTLLLISVLAAVAAQTPAWPTERLHLPSISLERLAPADCATILRLLRPELGPLFQGEAVSVVDRAIRSFGAERLNLGAISAVALSPSGGELCSSNGNCSFWIVDVPHRQLLLRAQGVQGYAVETAKPHSVPAIVTATRESPTQYERIRWQFLNDHYEPQACVTVEYADANNTPLAEPKITPHPCSLEGN